MSTNPLLIPFANDVDALSIGELSIENGTQRIAIFGQLEVRHDQHSLAQAKALAECLQQIIHHLEQQADLPAQLPTEVPLPNTTVDNPFA